MKYLSVSGRHKLDLALEINLDAVDAANEAGEELKARRDGRIEFEV